MKMINLRSLLAAFAAFFIAGSAAAQTAGTVTNHAFAIGKGAGQSGFTSLLCAATEIAIGQSAANPACHALTGDVTMSASGVTAIGASKVTNSMLAGSIAASKLVGTDIATVGTITSGTWQATPVAVAYGGTGATTAANARTNLGVAIGTNVQAWDADLDCLAALSAGGIVARTGAGTCAVRTVTAPAAGITVSNGDGVAGNPTLALANDLAAVEGLSGTGFAVRTGTDAWAQRSITGTANEITVSNGDGVSGNPTLSLPSSLTLTGKTVTGGTFSSPQINSPTGIVKGDVGLSNVDNTSDATKWAAAATLTNKTLNCANNTCTVRLGADVTGGLPNANLATMANNTVKGNVSGSTATPADLTMTQVTAALNSVVGDSGSGGIKGLVPAPGAGDALAGKYLDASGVWSVPAGGGGGGGGAVNDYDYLINGDGQVNQAVAGAGIADGAYGHDQWVALTQTGAIAVSTLTDVEDGLPNMIRLTQSQATAQRMGYIQPLEAQRVKRLRGKLVTLVMRLRNSTGGAIRYALVEHTGTADTLTKDIVNDWTSGTYTTGNFFAAQSGNITVRAVGSVTPAANTLMDATLQTTLGSTFNNLYVFVWTEGVAAQNATLDLAVNLRRGNATTPVAMRPFQDELTLCQRYYEKTYPLGDAPGTAYGTSGGGNAFGAFTYATANYPMLSQWTFKVEKRAPATMTVYSPFSGASGTIRNSNGNVDVSAGASASTSSAIAGVSNVSVAGINFVYGHMVANARL